MRDADPTRGHLLVVAGGAVALAAVAETARSLYDRIALDLAGLSPLERVALALWDLRPLAPAVFAAAALVLLSRAGERALRAVAAACSAYALLGLAVLAFAGWVAAAGSLGEPDELGFVFTRGERAVTLVTQVVAWAPLVAVFVLLARRASEAEAPAAEPPAPPPQLSDEMEELWRERLAFGPKRERARNLLGRIRELERAGDEDAARALAEEMRRL